MKNKLTASKINAIAHNILIEKVLTSAWAFVCSLKDEDQFDYAFVNTATEDYMDTFWHSTENVKMHYSMLQQDCEDMYNNAKTIFVDNFLNVNLASLTANSIYKTLDNISGDTAMRDDYYAKLSDHFKQFANDNAYFTFTKCKQYSDDYDLACSITAAQKKQLVQNYLY